MTTKTSEETTWRPLAKFWTLRGLSNVPYLMSLPAGLYPAWKKFVTIENPKTDKSERAFARSASGLMDFFRACVQNDLECVLPSAAADSVWHAWLFWNSDSFEVFSKEFFGRVINHRPWGDMMTQKEQGIQNTWITLARMRNEMPYLKDMPALFALDRKLSFPGGWAYAFKDGGLVHADIGSDREFKERLQTHPLIRPDPLKAAFSQLSGTDKILANHEARVLKRKGRQETGGGEVAAFWGGFDGDSGSDGGDGGGGGCGD